MNKERLLNVARALRESQVPGDFTMVRLVNPCGTPACALGHYAARTDLQDEYWIDAYGRFRCVSDDRGDDDDDSDAKHFGITSDESSELFGTEGCGEAKTAIEAAEYIEQFVAEHEVQS